jgi:molecular chaperone HtpG
VDGDVIDKLIQKDEKRESRLDLKSETWLKPVFKSQVPNENYLVTFEPLEESALPVIITQSEWSRRMKEMSKLSGGMGFYRDLPDQYNLVVNTNHPLVVAVADQMKAANQEQLNSFEKQLESIKSEKESFEKLIKGKKEDELVQEEKDKRSELEKQSDELEKQRDEMLSSFGKETPVVKQLIDLALLATNHLSGEALDAFVKRSITLLGK